MADFRSLAKKELSRSISRSKITLVKVLHTITLLSVGLAAVLLLDGCGGAS
jgi:hypothetical protein